MGCPVWAALDSDGFWDAFYMGDACPEKNFSSWVGSGHDVFPLHCWHYPCPNWKESLLYSEPKQ